MQSTTNHPIHHFCEDFISFTQSSDALLQSNPDSTHIMVVFDYYILNHLYDLELSQKLAHYMNSLLADYIRRPDLACRSDEDTFAILLANSKKIDVAMLVIYLTEMISNYNPELQIKLTFGTCDREFGDSSVQSLYQKAYQAMYTIRSQERRLLADYHDIWSASAAM